jgi:MFS transporter, DHA2 family, multidrug resistance protein
VSASAEVPHRRLITFTVMLASMMQVLDNTIANVALPRIQGSLSATQDQMTWILTSYIIASAIMMPLSGWLMGQIGRRRVLIYSVVGFTIASGLCGMAHSLPEIVVARLLQGMCGAALVPISQAVLLDINPRERHARAMSVWATGTTIGPILGPALGGWLTDHYNWRWVFYINVPVGLLCLLGIFSFMSETTIRKSRFDFFGFITLSLAVGAIQLLLDRGQLEDWFSSRQIWLAAAVAAVAFYLFCVHILTTSESPFISPALFRDRNFLSGCVFIFVVGVVLFATLALLPPLLQDLMNYPVVLTGLVVAPRGLGTIASMIVVGRLLPIFNVRLTIATGFALTAYSLWEMSHFYLQMDTSIMVWSGIAQGFGTGLVYVPLAAVTFATLAPSLRNEGTAVFSLIRNIGSSIGISTVTTLFTRNTQLLHSRLAEHVTSFGDALTGQMPSGPLTAQGLAMLNQRVTVQAQMLAYDNVFKVMMLLAVCAMPLVILLRAVKSETPVADTVVIE